MLNDLEGISIECVTDNESVSSVEDLLKNRYGVKVGSFISGTSKNTIKVRTTSVNVSDTSQRYLFNLWDDLMQLDRLSNTLLCDADKGYSIAFLHNGQYLDVKRLSDKILEVIVELDNRGMIER